MKKIYVHIDETGQDTQGDIFIVASVISDSDRAPLLTQLVEIEQNTGKKKTKWFKAHNEANEAYIRAVLNDPLFKGKIGYAVFLETTEYLEKTVVATAHFIQNYVLEDDYKATIFIDGLPKSQIHEVGSRLRQLNVRTKKVRGIKDENDALIRLADAVCGFVRASKSDQNLKYLLERAERDEYIHEIATE